MSPERWPSAKLILADALDQPAEHRRSFIGRVCGDDLELREELERLIEADAAADVIASPEQALPGVVSFTDLEAPTSDGVGGRPGSTLVGQRIGHFTITRLIGVGGMGTVYEARQDYPSRSVALKVMRWGHISKSALRRFEFEAQSLARMRHPGIAQVYEAGIDTSSGETRPYFAMELIAEARGLTDFADLRQLSLRERIALFIKVCEAVQHGHIRGIIHRDLKPSNILLSTADAGPHLAPQPRIIDFGVARSTDADIAITTLATDVRQLIGTIQYMSPEQCTGRVNDLDVRSDVYALGVVLYELLTGALPYDLTRSNALEAPSVIRSAAPVRPSAVTPAVRGDLQVIILKALEKERERRYQSAQDLADDLGRYLEGQAIRARPPSATYQAKVFVRRHRVAVGGLAAVALSLVIGAITSLVMYRDAVAARDGAAVEAARAKKVAGFLVESFHAADTSSAAIPVDAPGWDAKFYPVNARHARVHRTAARPGITVTAADLLRSAASAIETQFVDEPVVRADVAMAIVQGAGPVGLDLATQRRLMITAVESRRRALGSAHADTIDALIYLASSYAAYNEWRGAEPLLTEAIQACESVHGPLSAVERDASRRLVSVLMIDPTQVSRAAEIQHRMFDRCIEGFGPDDPATLIEESLLSMVFDERNQGSAERHARHAHAGLTATLGPDHYASGEAAAHLCAILRERGLAREPDAIRALSEQWVESTVRQFGVGYDQTKNVLIHHEELLVALGDLDAAAKTARDVVASAEQIMAPDNGQRLALLSRLARSIAWSHGDSAEAEFVARAALAAEVGIHAYHKPLSLAILAEVYLSQGRSVEAHALAGEALVLARNAVAEGWEMQPWKRGYMHGVLAEALAQRGCNDEAIAEFDEAIRLCNSQQIPQMAGRIVTLRRGLALADRMGDAGRSAVWRKELRKVAFEAGEYRRPTTPSPTESAAPALRRMNRPRRTFPRGEPATTRHYSVARTMRGRNRGFATYAE